MTELAKYRLPLLICLLVLIFNSMAFAVDSTAVRKEIAATLAQDVTNWRYLDQNIKDGQSLDLDTSSWKLGSPEFTWSEAPGAWLRKTIIIPEKVGGFSIAGSAVTLRIGVDDDGIIYVNGDEVQRFHWGNGKVVLTKNAQPGERYLVAIKGINTGGPGRLLSAKLEYTSLKDLQSQVESLLSDLSFAQTMADHAQGDDKARVSACIDNAWNKLDMNAFRAGDKDAFLKSVDASRSALQPLSADIKQLTCYLVGHAHIDMNWLWLWPETVDVCKNTFTSTTNFLDEYPEFRFSQSQPSTYVATEEHFPELFEKIKKYVKEGRWEITGGGWVEGDLNMASGESIVRQILYAKKYFREKFGVEPKICWSPDTFGHAWSIPQILKKSGIDYYYFMRCGKGQPLFWWEGLDGSRVLAYNDKTYNGNVSGDILNEAVNLRDKTGVKDCMVVYGVGDHGGGPTREHVNTALELQKRTLFPTVKFSTAEEYFDTVAAQKPDLPVIKDELNFIFEGCYTTHADIKRMNRYSENLLPAAETLSAISSVYGTAYPSGNFLSAWQDTCFNQFHDIFDGSAIHGSYDYSRELYERATAKGRQAVTTATDKIISQINTSGNGVPVVVFNTMSWMRTDVARMTNPLKDASSSAVVRDAAGKEWPCQIVGDSLEFVARDVPSMGYKVFWIEPGTSKVAGRIYSKGDILENEFFKVTVDQNTGAIAGIYDKTNKREVVPQGKKANLLQILMENAHGMSAWNIGKIVETVDLTKPDEVEMPVPGQVSASARVYYQYGNSNITQDITLYEGVPRIDIKLSADWREQGTPDKNGAMLKVAFPIDLKDPKATFEIPFGAIERPANGHEVPAQKWIDLSTDDYGVSLLNNCKYGHDVNGSVMRMTLLRSSYEPDPTPDQGVHEMTYSIYPHTGTWREALTVRRGYELNNPLNAITAKPHKGKLPASMSFAAVSPENVAVSALKMAEDGSGFIIRFYEWAGKSCTAKVYTKLPVKNAVETDLMERETGKKMTLKDWAVEVPVGKYEIKTLKLLK